MNQKGMTQFSFILAITFGFAFLFTGCSEKKAEGDGQAPAVESKAPAAPAEVAPEPKKAPEKKALEKKAPEAPAKETADAKADEKPSESDAAAPAAVADEAAVPEKVAMKKGEAVESGKELATLGGGCFWCTEAVMERLEGVSNVVSGYMGGHVENPSYEQVCTKTTGHAEVIQITFDPAVITFDEILDVFWQAHDPTTLNQQGADRGPQYRSVVFYHSAAQKNAAEQSKAKLDASGKYPDPAVTEITKADTFWVAEDGHQDYYELNKDSNPYCRVVISPKLKKLGME